MPPPPYPPFCSSSSFPPSLPLPVYSTGAVLKWCPKDNLVRGLLGTLKSKEKPVDLTVYPVHIAGDGGIWTKLR